MPVALGHTGRIWFNQINFSAVRWSVEWKRDEFDVTMTENLGVGVYTTGIEDVTVTFDAYYEEDDDPFSAAGISLQPGYLGELVIQYDKANGLGVGLEWKIPSFLIISVGNEASVRDTVGYSVMGKASYGQFNHPAGVLDKAANF